MNTTQSVSNTSRMRSSEAVAVCNSFSFRSFMMMVMMVIAIVVGGKVAWGEEHTVTWTGTSGALGSGIGPGTISTGTFSWSYTRTLISGSSYTGWTSNCIQLGKNGGVENITFRTSNIPGTIKSVSVECSSYQAKHNVSISVGGTSYLASTPTASWTTVSAKTGTGSSSGEIVISFTGGTRALYIKSIRVVYETGAAVPYTVTFIAGTGSCDYSSIQESPAGSGVILPAAVPLDDCSSYTFYGWSTEEVESETTSVPSIVGMAGDLYSPTRDTTLYAVYKKIRNTYSEKTYDFSYISFNNWTSSYTEHIVSYDVADVIFESASKQTGTITDIPVTKGNDVFLVLHDLDCRIKQVSFVCRQWSTNAQTITLHYSTDGGSSYTSTDTTSTNFSISNNSLNANTNAVKLTFSSQSNQIGIESCTIKVREIIYNSNPLCNSATITYDANGATTGTVPTDPNSPYPLVNGQKDINLLYNTGNLAKTGYTFDGWNTEYDGSGISYSEGAPFTLTDNIALYAKWKPNNHTIRWRVNGLSDGDYTYPYNTLIPDGDVPSDESTLEYVCDDKTFVGWSETASELFDGVPTLLQRNQIVNTKVTGNKTYYAVFADVTDAVVRWNLVTDEDDLAAGDSVLIVASEFDYAIGINQKSNNREAISITRPSGDINTINFPFDENVCVFEIQNGNVTDTWAFYDATNDGYIYAASSSSNHLKTENELDDNGSWNITISNEGVATIIAQGTYTHNILKYNPNNGTPLFSCYTGGLQDVSIYKKTGGTTYSNYTTFCPCEYDITGIDDGDMVWAGKNANADWNSTINWTRYESGYHLVEAAPTSSNNVYIIEKAGCGITALPHINENATCNNLTMLNGLNIDIAENKTLTINGTATFTNGVINGNVIFGSGATVSASTSSYVNGKVTKNGMSGAFTFPTGTASLYAPFEASSSTASNVSVQYAAGSEGMPDWWNHSGNLYDAGLNHASDRENWQISASASTTLSDIKLYWNAAASNYHSFEEDASDLNSYLNVAVVKKNGFYWQNLGKASIDGSFSGAGSITAAEPLTITVGAKAAGDGEYFATFASSNSNVVLPIELTSFTANCNGRSAFIEWTTATEKNNDFFVLERSTDAINFKEITRIAGAGNSIEPISYAYTDYGVRSGDNYYRLVQVDYDGTSTASEIIVANCPAETLGEPDVLAFPNPFDDNLTLHFENFGNIQATIEVYDMLGRLVQTQKVNCSQNDYEVVLRLAGLSDGTYNVRISTKELVINRQVVKN